VCNKTIAEDMKRAAQLLETENLGTGDLPGRLRRHVGQVIAQEAQIAALREKERQAEEMLVEALKVIHRLATDKYARDELIAEIAEEVLAAWREQEI